MTIHTMNSFDLDEECMRAIESARLRARHTLAPIHIPAPLPPVGADFAPLLWFMIGALSAAVVAMLMAGPRVIECLSSGGVV